MPGSASIAGRNCNVIRLVKPPHERVGSSQAIDDFSITLFRMQAEQRVDNLLVPYKYHIGDTPDVVPPGDLAVFVDINGVHIDPGLFFRRQFVDNRGKGSARTTPIRIEFDH